MGSVVPPANTVSQPANPVSPPDWRVRHDRAKALVGEAPEGTPQYYRNAAIVLSQHAGPGMRAETRAKLEDLTQSEDPEIRRIAQNALAGQSYPLDDIASRQTVPRPTPSWQQRHERAKSYTGMAEPGTSDYDRNAAVVLSQHAGLGMRAETRLKVEQLAQSDNPETRRIAQDALNGIRFDVE